MQTMVVTGGAGFVGSNLARLALAETDFRVVVIDKLTYAGRRENLADLSQHPRFLFLEADITDRSAMADLFRDFEPLQILNLAAESHVDRSIDGPRAFLETNIGGTFELLEAARAYLRGKGSSFAKRFRFLQVSTDEVYGSLGDTGLFDETTRYAPNSPYAASKAAADHLVRAYHRTYDLPALISNCSNNYGPFQLPEKLIPLTILNAVEGRDLPVYGDGSNVRDWIHVEDHCRGLLRILERGLPGEGYNLGAGCERTNLEVVEAICDLLQGALPAAENPALGARRGVTSYRDLLVFVEDRPGHDRRYAIDASKAKADLEWQPRQDFLRGLELTVRWYLEHPSWCEAVRAEGLDRQRRGLLEGVRP